jgi:hypothetical protein
MPVTSYSTTPANNNGAPPNGAPEGWAPGDVNAVVRQIMTDIAVEAQKNAVKVLASVAGTDTITGSMTPDLTAYSAGMLVVLTPAVTNTGAATLNIDTLGALDVFRFGGEALLAGDLVAGVPAYLLLDSGADDFYLLNPQNVGFRNLPQNIQNGNYTCVLSDSGKHIINNSGSGTTFTIPANASVAYPLGTVLTFVNRSGAAMSIAITSDDIVLAGTTTTGTRTLSGSSSIATASKVTSTVWIISGAGLS